MGNRLYYLRDKKNIRTLDTGAKTRGNPVSLIVSTVDKEHNRISYAVAVSHPKDHFDKQRAIVIASGRLAKKPIVIENQDLTHMRGHEITMKIMQHIVENNLPHTNLRKLAVEWLKGAEVPRAQV